MLKTETTKFRTHNCNQLNIKDLGSAVKLSGWVHTVRDHGGLIFIDLRDHFGITQLVFNQEKNNDIAKIAHAVKNESVICIKGKVIQRSNENLNSNIATGEIEIEVEEIEILSKAETLPILVNSDQEFPEDLRLKYRFLDLRKKKMHDNILMRSELAWFIRQEMHAMGFNEFQTPILTGSSPEGARDYLVPSRIHAGKFYALPQAPQQFKQLLMVSGFEKYFQIAPCFRDEDSRADRSPGEFYQLDIEMSFVTQEEVFAVVEPLMRKIFTKFSDKKITKDSFQKIPYADSIEKYGTDKPDLRIPLHMQDAAHIFKDSEFTVFKNNLTQGKVIKAIKVENAAHKSRSFFDKLNKFAIESGAPGLGYISFNSEANNEQKSEISNESAQLLMPKGPIVKFLNQQQISNLIETCEVKSGDVVFFISDTAAKVADLGCKLIKKLAEDLDLIDENIFSFCWITEFPFFEYDHENKKLDFGHNPFSMPIGGMEVLESAKNIEQLLAIKAFQYDIVCNGIELSSGAIRNHNLEILFKAFALIGCDESYVRESFSGMVSALSFGAPPHGGIAPGFDRMLMLLANEPNIREVIAFPMNQSCQDHLMSAPSHISEKHLKELGLQIIKKL